MEESMSTREEGTSMEALNTIPFLTKPYTRRITKDSTRAKILRDETGTKGLELMEDINTYFISFKKTNIIQIKVHETCKSSFMD
jgi:hypothetical protein